MKKQQLQLEKAEQQITGFLHCYEGYDLKSLIESMGLTTEEFTEMLKQGMLSHLPEELGKELEEIFYPPTNIL